MWYSFVILFIYGFHPFLAMDLVPIINHTVIETDAVLLNCDGNLGNKNYWKHENGVIYLNREVQIERYRNNTTVFGNYSLYINVVSIFHNGEYTCELRSGVTARHSVNVEVSPEITINGFKQSHDNRVFFEEGEEVTVVCYAHRSKPPVALIWMITNKTVSESSKIFVQVSTNSQENLTFDVISTLKTRLLDRTGILSCISSPQTRSGSQRVDVPFTLYASPSMLLTINGYSSERKVYVDKYEEVYAVCSALGARPHINLTWMINDKPADTYYVEHSSRRAEMGAYDSISKLRFNLSENEEFGTISCTSNFEVINVTSVVQGTICTYVLPVVIISVNGDATVQVHDVSHDDQINATCIATGARPAVDISWLMNGRKFNGPGSSIKTTVEHVNNTFQTESTIRFTPRYKEGNITCVISNPFANTTHYYAFFRVADREEHSLGIVIALSSTGCIFVTVLIILLCVVLKRSRATGRRNLGYSRSICKDVALSECSKGAANDEPKALSTLRKEAQGEFVEFPALLEGSEKPSLLVDRQRLSSVKSDRKSRSGSTSDFSCPPTLDLPNVPQVLDQPTYYTPPKDVYAGYTKMKDNILQGRMFSEKDICLVCKIKMGKIYNRWMGSVAVTDKTNKCVVLTTAADVALESNIIHWDNFVERVLELPENENINHVEGFYIDDAKITYLVYEHVICETLDVRVNACHSEGDSTPTRQPLSGPEVMRYLFGILEGVQLLQSYGFLHPGLTTKKVLLTKQGTCKLYDFCLAEDAAYRVIVQKSEQKCTLNQFAPETLSKDEYTSASDVWSTANVIWEILSAGIPPFTDEVEISDDDVTVPEWPDPYQEIRNNRLFECWRTVSSRRPTISLLKMSFEKVFESLEEQRNCYQHSTDTLDLYVPMKGTAL